MCSINNLRLQHTLNQTAVFMPTVWQGGRTSGSSFTLYFRQYSTPVLAIILNLFSSMSLKVGDLARSDQRGLSPCQPSPLRPSLARPMGKVPYLDAYWLSGLLMMMESKVMSCWAAGG